MFSKTSLIAAAGSLAFVTFGFGTAQAHHTGARPSVTGVGFSHTRAGATGRAIRAWKNEVEDRYGPRFANYNKARRTTLSCEYIGGVGNLQRRKRIGVDGDPNARWTCATSARPVASPRPIGNGDDVVERPRLTRGIGFADTRYQARRRAIRAWRQAAREDYGRGFQRFWMAANRSVECARIGDRFDTFSRRRAIKVIGNPDARFSCTARGRPRNALARLRWN